VNALEDVRVLDLGRYVAAPYCTMILSDLGAEVIRVERPGGDHDRRLGLRAVHGETFIFAGLARNKKGVALDLSQAQAMPVLEDLIRHCDVLVHNFSPAAAGRLGLSYEHVRAIRPDIVCAAISSFGASGPDAHRTGFDPIAQVAAGAAAITGDEHGGPIRAGLPWVDYSTGLAAAAGVLAALRHRDRTGDGQEVRCALLHTAVSYMAPVLAEATVAGQVRPRLGNQPAHVAVSNLYPCRDGHVYIVAVSRSMWRALTALLGRSELADDPDLVDAEQRYERRSLVDEAVAGWTQGHTVDEAVELLAAARVPCTAYRTPAEVAEDEQVAANEMLCHLDLGHDGLDHVPASTTPVAFSTLVAPPVARPPRPGEHNDDIYGDLLGYDASRLAALRQGGVI
jgi:crotonobetainyl-CoA:carnitine CoA-transferase CaiB-like acyl-CoA transferase